MSLSHKILTALLVGATLVAADDLNDISGTVRHSPLRLEVNSDLGWDGVIPHQAIHPTVREVLSEAAMANAYLTFGSKQPGPQKRISAVQGRTRAAVSIIDKVGFGANTVATLASNRNLWVIGQTKTSTPTGATLIYYEVVAGDARGFLSAGQVQIGETNVVAGVIGGVLAPGFAAGTKFREARFFHPDGEVFRGKVESLKPDRFRQTADGLAGGALIRLGGGFFRGNEHNTGVSLGMAIRFYDPAAGPPPATPRANDFDLLVVSWAERFHHLLWRTPTVSDTSDFFKNEYYPAMPYTLEGEDIWVRVVPAKVETEGPHRIGKLFKAVEKGEAVFFLEVQGEPEAYKTRRGTRYKPRVWTRLAKITIEEYLPDFDQQALRYSPGMAGRGFEATGWIMRIRRPVYSASAKVRDGLVDGVEGNE